MGEDRRRIVQRRIAGDLLGRVAQVVVAANDVRDLHGHVVHDRAEVVGRRPVGAHENPVVQGVVVEGDGAENGVLHHRLTALRHLESQRVRLRLRYAGLPARAGVAELLLPGPGGGAERVEGLGRATTAVCAALGEQLLGVRAVDVEPLRLAIAECGRAFVPVEPEPAKDVEDLGDVLLGRTRAVRVLDAQDEDALVVPREGPVEERGSGAAHVEGARGTWRKADSDRVRHGLSL